MGILISSLWRKRSTEEVLQRLEDERAALEETKVAVRRRQHRLRSFIVAYSVLLYVVAAGAMYWRGLPTDTSSCVMAAATLLLFPTVMYLLKGMLSWYYERKIRKSEVRMTEIKKKKEQILEEVQEKETYKVAKQILEKYAPDQLRRHSPRTVALASNSEEEGSLRHRQQLVPAFPGRPPFTSTPRSAQGPLRPGPTPGDPARTPMLTGSGRFSGRTPLVQSPMAMRGRGLPVAGGPGRTGPPLPRPVLARERGYMDRMMDYLVGDGPANRYALICCQCQGHNGMALQEEFQYLAFRCCYCYAWNPARKQRPTAPRLPAAPTSDSMHESDTTETTDSEPEVPAAAAASPTVEEATSSAAAEDGAPPAHPARAPGSSADPSSAPASEAPAPAGVTPVPAGEAPVPADGTPAPACVTPVPSGVTPVASEAPAPACVTPVPAGLTPVTGVTPVPASEAPAPDGVTPVPAVVTPVPAVVTPVPAEGSDGTTATPAGVEAADVAEVEEPASGTADVLMEANTSEAGRQLRVSSLTPDAGAESEELGCEHPADETADETLPSHAVLVPPPVEEYSAAALSEEAPSPPPSPASLPTATPETRLETSPDTGRPTGAGPGSVTSPAEVPFIDDTTADS